MKIGIISEPLNQPLTGVGNYLYNLIKELLNKNLCNNIVLINYKNCNIFPTVNKTLINNPLKKISKTYLWYAYIFALNSIRGYFNGLDIIHNPYQAPTFFDLKGQKYIITVHDLIQILFPKEVKPLVHLVQKTMLPRTIRTADKIISVSHNTKKDVIKYFKIPEDKIEVIYNGVNEEYKPLPDNEIEKIRQKYNLEYPFILYVGGLAPNKNIPTLIKAFYKLKKQRLLHKLVIIGAKRLKYNSIFETIDKLNLQKDVIFTGYVPEEDLPALYNAADLFVYPSIYEGFGLPPLEAMACGIPVITSNSSSLPEVVGNAGIMVDPYDVDGLSRAMYEVLTNDGLREELRKRGLERAKLFTWKKCAEEHLKVYEEVYKMK
ncbi:glycosyltransferase family 4 protein [Methanothermococcus sp. SCGC AD-155-C09]|nr:glycosyltransferase family 4 protein [Methanothermococcus sp. SCGC AD-155-C09]